MNDKDYLELEYIPVTKAPNKAEVEMNKEQYIKNKNNRPKNKAVSHGKTKKKGITKKTLVAAMLAASALTFVGTALNTGKHNIINNVIESGIDKSNITPTPTSNGLIFIENGVQIDGEKFISDLCTAGQEYGFDQEQMAIYCEYKYGVKGISEGLGQEIETKLQSYIQFLNGNEQVEWRQK